jgi:membrane-associated PAP2 superfamily phosphatase
MTRAIRLLWCDVRWPLIAFVPLAAVLATTNIDEVIAGFLFFDPLRAHWLGADSWWINEALHTGGRWLIRLLVAGAACGWLGTYLCPEFRVLRRSLGYFVVATVLAVGSVGLLKTLTNVDCPWDLLSFGGRYPLVHLFADRPDGLRHAHCFPAAHASSGYALVALYFIWRERSDTLARIGLCIGLVTGLVFGVAQQSRGAHFVSHDLWSAFIVWLVAASVYAFGFGARLAPPELDVIADTSDSFAHARHVNEPVDETTGPTDTAGHTSQERLLDRHDPSSTDSSCGTCTPRPVIHGLYSAVAHSGRNRRERCKPSCQRCSG